MHESPNSQRPQLEVGDGCPYCDFLFEDGLEIMTCYVCHRQGCSDCIPAGACCLEDEHTSEKLLDGAPETDDIHFDKLSMLFLENCLATRYCVNRMGN